MIIVAYYPDSSTHLAIGLTGLGPEQNVYISFFPGNEKAHAGLRFRLHDLEHDMYKDRRSQHDIRSATVVILPSEESCGYGLSEQAIYNWWVNEFNPGQECFGWFENNCSSIVYRALCAGQLGSTTLNNTLLDEKKSFCTPSNIFSYASNLSELLLKDQTVEGNLFIKFAEIKDICECERLHDRYSQVTALYLRIMQLNTNYVSSILNKTFCDLITNVLTTFRENLLCDDMTYHSIITLTSTDEITEVNVDLYFDKLHLLMEYIDQHQSNNAFKALQTAIANDLLTPMAKYINQFEPGMYQDRNSIKIILQNAEQQIHAGQNPHKIYVQKSDPLPREFNVHRNF